MAKELTAERLDFLLSYDPMTGKFSWKTNKGKRKAGMTTGCINKVGYVLIGIDGKIYYAHRLAWLASYGAWPIGDLDHINQNKADNRISNLRSVSRSHNMQNTGIQKNNTSGYRGVTWHAKAGCWMASIKLNKKKHYLGLFDTAENAGAAYMIAAEKMHTHRPIEAGQ